MSINIVLLSCGKDNSNIKNVLAEYQNREVRIPKTLRLISIDKDTFCQSLFEAANKIVAFIDTGGCTECKMRLESWSEILDETRDSLQNVSVLFIISPKDGEIGALKMLLKKHSFSYPVFLDSLHQFGVQNMLPKDSRFHTFLLNKKNRIVLMGSPAGNRRIWNLYKAYLKGEKIQIGEVDKGDNDDIEDLTAVCVKKRLIDLGKVQLGSGNKVLYKFVNAGDRPLLIQSVKTSCGCTVAKYDKMPVPPGKTTTITLEYKPITLGFFHKTADVVCNIPEGFVRLSISGVVVDN